MDQVQHLRDGNEIPSKRSTEIDVDDIHRRSPRHQWLPRHLEVLCLLYKMYDNTPREYSEIFSKIFQDELVAEGFESGIKANTLVARWNSIKDRDGRHDLWEKVHLGLTPHEARHRYRHLLDDIEESALDLKIPLTLRVQEHHGVSRHLKRLGPKARRVKGIRGVLGDAMLAMDGTDSEIEPPAKLRRVRSAGDSPRGAGFRQTDNRFPAPHSAPVGGGTPKVARRLSTASQAAGQVTESRQLNEEPPKRLYKVLPRLLFRYSDDHSSSKGPFFNNCTGFIAGRFVEDPANIPTPPVGAALKAVALSHLTPEFVTTPFISFFSSMLPALHRAIRSSSNPYLTIIDGHIAEQGLKDRFGERTKVTYSVYDIVTEFGLQLRGGYHGKFSNYVPASFIDKISGPSEFLMYGVVNKDSIVGVLKIQDLMQSEYYGGDFFSVLQLDLIKQAHYASGLDKKLRKLAEPMSYKTRQVVQKFLGLANVQPAYQEVLARNICRWWRFQEPSAEIGRSEKGDYMNGIFNVMGGKRSNSVGLEEEDEEDEEDEDEEGEEDFPEKLHQEADLSGQSLNSEAIENPGLRLDSVPAQTLVQPSDEDEDLVDRQFEAQCPDILADHRRAFNDGESIEPPPASVDTGTEEVRAASPGSARTSPLYTFPRALRQATEEASAASRASSVANINDWNGSWKSMTPQIPPTDFRAAGTMLKVKKGIIDLSGDTDDEEVSNSATRVVEQVANTTLAAREESEKKLSLGVGRTMKGISKGRKRTKNASKETKENEDEYFEIIDYVDFSED